MDVQMDVQMNIWTEVWKDVRTDIRMDVQTDVWADAQTDIETDRFPLCSSGLRTLRTADQKPKISDHFANNLSSKTLLDVLALSV